jgi:hypothetical protein
MKFSDSTIAKVCISIVSVVLLITLINLGDKESKFNNEPNYKSSAFKLYDSFISGDSFKGREQLMDIFEIITADKFVSLKELKLLESKIRETLPFTKDIPFNVPGLYDDMDVQQK